MSLNVPFPKRLELPADLTLLLIEAAAKMAKESRRVFQANSRPKRGITLRPGRNTTPLWNALVAEIRPHLRSYGDQANLGRLLGLPRQRINAFVTRRSQMPDAERTLQLIAWLTTVRQKAAD